MIFYIKDKAFIFSNIWYFYNWLQNYKTYNKKIIKYNNNIFKYDDKKVIGKHFMCENWQFNNKNETLKIMIGTPLLKKNIINYDNTFDLMMDLLKGYTVKGKIYDNFYLKDLDMFLMIFKVKNNTDLTVNIVSNHAIIINKVPDDLKKVLLEFKFHNSILTNTLFQTIMEIQLKILKLILMKKSMK